MSAWERTVRLERILPFLVCAVVFAVASWAASVYAVGVFHDDGVYVILAKSLANGDGYRDLHIPGAPSSTHYPPGYPLLLAALWKVAPAFPENIGVFLMANALLLPALIVAERLVREEAPPARAALPGGGVFRVKRRDSLLTQP